MSLVCFLLLLSIITPDLHDQMEFNINATMNHQFNLSSLSCSHLTSSCQSLEQEQTNWLNWSDVYCWRTQSLLASPQHCRMISWSTFQNTPHYITQSSQVLFRPSLPGLTLPISNLCKYLSSIEFLKCKCKTSSSASSNMNWNNQCSINYQTRFALSR